MTAVRTSRIALMLTEDERDAIREYRFVHRIDTEAAAARALMKKGLDVENEKGPAATGIAPDHDQNHTTSNDGGIDA